MQRTLTLISLLLLASLLAACNISTPDASPTPEILLSDTPTLAITNTPTPSLTPSATATLTLPAVTDIAVIVATPIPTQPDFVPTDLVTPTETPGAWVHVVESGETLGYIMQLQPWGYPAFDEAVINAILQANNMAGPESLRVGQELLIPRRTPTPIPEGIELTQAAAEQRGETIIGNQAYAQGQQFDCHVVQEGETLLGIMEQYDTTLEVLSQQNQNLNWLGCDFTNPSGGPSCNPTIFLDQCITVPLPTGTPVPTATPSGNETPTATPTYPPARIFWPPQGSIATGVVELRWVSVGILQPNEVYLVEVTDRTLGRSTAYATTATAYTLPTEMIPTDGQEHIMDWRVVVGRAGGDGTYQPIGGTGDFRTFQWRSR